MYRLTLFIKMIRNQRPIRTHNVAFDFVSFSSTTNATNLASTNLRFEFENANETIKKGSFIIIKRLSNRIKIKSFKTSSKNNKCLPNN